MKKTIFLIILAVFFMVNGNSARGDDNTTPATQQQKEDLKRAEKMIALSKSIAEDKKIGIEGQLDGLKVNIAAGNIINWNSEPRLHKGGDMFDLGQQYRELCDKIISVKKGRALHSLAEKISALGEQIKQKLKEKNK